MAARGSPRVRKLRGDEGASSGRGSPRLSKLRGEEGAAGMEMRAETTAAIPHQPERDSRVPCHNKRLVTEVMEMCSDFSKALLQNQPHLFPERRDKALQEASWNFERAVQENITVNGSPWQEASDSESALDIKILEDQFDEVIVDTTTKRKYYPRKILPHVSKTLKAEREILGLYQPFANPEQVRFDPNQLSRMADLTAETSAVSKKLKDTMKSLTNLVEKTEGLSQVLSLHPTLQHSRIHKEVFSQNPSEEKAKTMDTEIGDIELTPTETEIPAKMKINRKRKRLQSSENRLYPLQTRSKRKISLAAQNHQIVPTT